ncbi:MAG: methyltransferase domain-containing protein [Planctomycetes bacterium]|nr:methyltransferase domain-containing protein [Planctomycetota bacterium]
MSTDDAKISADAHATPGDHLDMAKMPGHWALARIGKRVLRPGGIEMTRRLLAALDVQSCDHVVEFAPGLGMTARMTLRLNPASYTAIERDKTAAARVARYLDGPNRRCVTGSAEATGLDDACATVVYGEAMLTMQTAEQKRRIVQEAVRLLRKGGRYGVHEICLVPEDIERSTVESIERDLAAAIHAGVRPLTMSEWRGLFTSAGLDIEAEATNPFHLLEPARVIRDEGVLGAMRIAFNVLRDREARKRVLEMRRAIRRHAEHMRAVMLVGVKP